MENSFQQRIKKQVLVWTIILLPIAFIFILFINISLGNLGFMPSFELLENPKSALATEIYTEDGAVLGTFYYSANRSRTEFSELSPYLVDALVSTEDKRFYKHSGIDFYALGRVFFKTLLGGNSGAGGGSTVTQQLAKNLFPREDIRNPFQMVNRKLREWVIAVKLEKSYTKEEIIAMYFNQFDFLNLAVGIKSASKVYFNCNPNELQIEQAAMLVGMAQNPSLYNPLRRPDLTQKRRNIVLFLMAQNNCITQQALDSLSQIPIELDYQKVDHHKGLGTYFREYLRTTLSAKEPQKDNYYSTDRYEEDLYEWEHNPLYGWCNKNFKPDSTPYNIYEDGLRIYTTINSKMQEYAENAIEKHLKNDLQVAFDNEKRGKPYAPFTEDLDSDAVKKIMDLSMRRSERYRVLRNKKISKDSILANFNQPVEMTVFSWHGDVDTILTPMDSIRYYKHFLQSGLMSMDPHTGYVKAYVGGIDHKHFQYDHVTKAKRQIGSTFKPFLYTLAMQNGYTPCDQVPNVPVTITLDGGDTWTPNSGSPSKWDRKIISLRFGLAHSLNNVSAWLMSKFQPRAVIDLAKNMGVRSYIPRVPSICLGVADLSLYEMVGAYSTYANKGVYTQPIFVTRIEDKNGNVLASFQPQRNEAISENTAYLMLELLQGVVERGTGVRLHSEHYPYQIHANIGGKTGTTQNQSDGWFMGVTPNLVTGVWTGAEDRATHFDGISLGQGANMALPIWAWYMKDVYADEELNIKESDTFEAPEVGNFDFDCLDIADHTNGSSDGEENVEEELFGI